jgi:acetylornithine deacetylase/succinyl-diaminopimelate desuccinylase-like protein
VVQLGAPHAGHLHRTSRHRRQAGDTVLLYGHLDKQPEMTGWREGLGPWTPVIEGDKLYGRGGADDGYAIFASLTAINALRDRACRTPAA